MQLSLPFDWVSRYPDIRAGGPCECYASVPTKDSAIDLSDMDEIFQQSVEVYNVNGSARDSQAWGSFGGLVGSFVKFPFTLQLPDECSDIVAGGDGTANVSLPPSLLQNGKIYIWFADLEWAPVFVRAVIKPGCELY
ncbi:hypothetical protein FIBSPDRAFT_932972 [Athelia psychrophila]|uniref:Uncharacterized protein n=1 Tax=Athelia psychrophila TaxID=1759441 RepID=A0A166HVZ0_9AGAM|nr:hypothetical protein FIBSPDRAFT_932972 [Fibularhizoctonia sp. CBS 109695]